MKTPIKITVIIVNWNTQDLLARALQSIPNNLEKIEIDFIVVDNHSTDSSLAMLGNDFPDVKVIKNVENVGFAAANNQAMAEAQGDWFLLINSDATLKPEALTRLVELGTAQPRAAIVGGKLLNPDGSFQASFAKFPTLWQEFLMLSGLGRLLFGQGYPSVPLSGTAQPRRVDYVIGACMLVRRAAYDSVGGFDETYFMYAEEVDLCYRMEQNGWETWFNPRAEIVHIGGASSQSIPVKREADLYRSRLVFFRKHLDPLQTRVLVFLMISLTYVKKIFHSLIRSFTSGKRGREVVDPAELRKELRMLL